jgi:hypothetical protein
MVIGDKIIVSLLWLSPTNLGGIREGRWMNTGWKSGRDTHFRLSLLARNINSMEFERKDFAVEFSSKRS